MKIQVPLKSDRNNGYFTFHSFLLGMRNVSDGNFRENQNTYFMFDNAFGNRAVYEIVWKNIVETFREV
jgi:hypothetical protein